MKFYIVFILFLSLYIKSGLSTNGFGKLTALAGVQKDHEDESRYVLMYGDFTFCSQDCGNYTCQYLTNNGAPSILFTLIKFQNFSNFKINPIWSNTFDIVGVIQKDVFTYFYPIPELSSTCENFENCYNYMINNMYSDYCIGYILTPKTLNGAENCYNDLDVVSDNFNHKHGSRKMRAKKI